jgi:pSer/pThr/pTyr-binding forkhead associated (FHA) protein
VPRPTFASPWVYVLAVVEGEAPRDVHRIDRPETVIGREREADLVVDDDEVSKRHCLVRVDGPVCTISDLGSLNGTRLNGRRLRDGVAQRVRHLDQIRIGTTRLMLLTGKFRSLPGEE